MKRGLMIFLAVLFTTGVALAGPAAADPMRRKRLQKEALLAATIAHRGIAEVYRLGKFPEGYRHLGYLQSHLGFTVKGNLPGLRGPVVETLYAEGRAWLAGSDRPGDVPS